MIYVSENFNISISNNYYLLIQKIKIYKNFLKKIDLNLIYFLVLIKNIYTANISI